MPASTSTRAFTNLLKAIKWVRAKKRRKYALAAGAAGGFAGWKSRKKYQKFGGNIVLPDYRRRY